MNVRSMFWWQAYVHGMAVLKVHVMFEVAKLVILQYC